MTSPANQSLVNLLLESGVPSTEEAAQLAVNLNGGSWVSQVLDSGKVDEQRFLAAIGNFFRVPVTSIDAKTIDRDDIIGLTEPFCFSTSHSAHRGEGKCGGAGDLRSFQFDWPPARVAAFEKAGRMGAGAARTSFCAR